MSLVRFNCNCFERTSIPDYNALNVLQMQKDTWLSTTR